MSGWQAQWPGMILELEVFPGLLVAGIQIDDARLGLGYCA
jgi:hypothetical protein